MSRRRVLLVAAGLGPGGMERLLVNQVAFGDRSRFQYSVGFLKDYKDQLVPELEELGCPVHLLVRDGLPWPWTLAQAVRAGGFDIVHVHSPLAASVVRLASRTMRRRPAIVYTEHNSWGAYRAETRWANRLTYRLDDATIAVSRAARDSVPPSLRSQVVVVDHGIDLDAVRANLGAREAARRRFGAEHDDVVLGIVANMRPEKNYAGILDAAAVVLTEAPRARFVSIGQGPLLDDLRRRHAASGLGERFEILGHQPDAPSLMSGFDVFFLGSDWEGLPVAFMEARALGLPVVVTAVGGLVDHVEEGVDGLLVPPRDPGRLAAALSRVVLDDGLRSSMAAASARAASTFDARAAVRRVEACYPD